MNNPCINDRKWLNIRLDMWVCLALALATVIVYWQVRHFPFIHLEDPLNILDNPHVQGRITLEKIVWAFTGGTWVTNYWAPLVWLSFLMDYQLYGLNAGGFHATNLLLHIANTLLLFWVFRKMTGALWRSAFVAALFALHPLHVESVAWVTERKDVLSTLFWFLTLWSYIRYVDKPCAKRYLLVCLCFILGLMSKPMVVTLPFVLVLMDFWPLERIQFGQALSLPYASQRRISLSQSIFEKIPLFLLVAVSSAAAFITQHKEGAVATLGDIPFHVRFENVLVSYVSYILKMIWPHPLAVLYPHPGALPVWKTICASIVLAGVFFFALRSYKRPPWFLFGWLWYVGTLVPVIGWVVIGPHAMADRYTYIPMVGLFIMVSWGIYEWLPIRRFKSTLLAVGAFLVISALGGLAWNQVRYWSNSITLFQHALNVTTKNSVMHNNLGVTLAEQGDMASAVDHYVKALQIAPRYAQAYNNLGIAFAEMGRAEEAIRYYTEALNILPHYADAHYNLGIAMDMQGDVEAALQHYAEALRIDPGHARAHNNIGVAFIRRGNLQEAIGHFQEALRLKPDYAGARFNLEKVLKTRKEE